MTRSDILDAARHCVTVDRAATHGDAEDTFTRIAAFWSAYSQHPFAPHDVAAMLALLKVARIKANPAHADNWIDLAGYAACGGELAAQEDRARPAKPNSATLIPEDCQ